MIRNRIFFLIALVFWLAISCQSKRHEMKPNFVSLEKYQQQLNSLRQEFSAAELPEARFFLFGMGNREKLLYKDGAFMQAISGEVLYSWEVETDHIIPNDYTVYIITKNQEHIEIREDEEGIFLNQNGEVLAIDIENPIQLPDFEEYKYDEVLKVLHHEILINILDGKPLPNFFVYDKPWYRDAAMMAMCLEATGNLELIRNWVMSLTDPYDRNNAGETEADNLGQALYLVSLFSDTSHVLVSNVLKEVPKFEKEGPEGTYILGRTDFHETPAFQTKWLKYGLKKLGLPDKYSIPNLQDDYSALFWWDYKEHYAEGTIDAYEAWNLDANNYYPYIGWAADHFHGLKRNPVSSSDYPLSWEIEASQANYDGISLVSDSYVKKKCAAPHTWHSAEMFLYLLTFK